MRRAIGFFSVVVALTLGCIEEDLTGPPGAPLRLSKIVIKPDSARMVVGETRDFRATAFDLSGDTVIAHLAWQPRDTTVVTVEASHRQVSGRPTSENSNRSVAVRAKRVGETLIRVSSSDREVHDSVKVIVE